MSAFNFFFAQHLLTVARKIDRRCVENYPARGGVEEQHDFYSRPYSR